MHPRAVPECLQNLTQIEEMLIAHVSSIMYVYIKHGGQAWLHAKDLHA